MSEEACCKAYPLKDQDPGCTLGNMNWLGTDDQGRDVLARLIYGFRMSVLFGLTLTVLSSVIGIVGGCGAGLFRRLDRSDLPALHRDLVVDPRSLYILIIISSRASRRTSGRCSGSCCCSWTALVGVVRAEFLRGRNFEYVNAARALGVGNCTIMFRHLLPNAMVATLTFLPFILSGSITTLTALDFLGFGLPPGSPRWASCWRRASEPAGAVAGADRVLHHLDHAVAADLHRRGVRDAFDPRKTFNRRLPRQGETRLLLLSVRDLSVAFRQAGQAVNGGRRRLV
jgi:microcin C transport system permease protein